MAVPPSTRSDAPVTAAGSVLHLGTCCNSLYFAMSEAIKHTGSAISSGSPSRPRGIRFVISDRLSSSDRSSLLMAVSIVPKGKSASDLDDVGEPTWQN